ncbi:MAG: cytochrome c3 family protein [Gallionella sp.]|jgi:cytochrome b subunit of formate dehydrogenase
MFKNSLKFASWFVVGLLITVSVSVQAETAEVASGATPAQISNKLDNASCLKCHSKEIKVAGAGDELRALHAIRKLPFSKSVHAELQCVSCHTGVKDGNKPHQADAKTTGCVQCHTSLWDEARKDNLTEEKSRLGVVVQNIEAYKKTYHARQNADDPTRVNASCDDCHDTHSFNVPPKGSIGRTAWHLTIPKTCGEKCHTDQLEEYATSVHGKKVLEEHSPKAAVCTDCHTSHGITNTSIESFKLDIVQACGGCHKENLKSYSETFHGQINALGYGYTAKCYNCHGSHGILSPTDPESTVHPNNRLKTCQQCHSGNKGWAGLQKATPGFVSFAPHANTHDFEKYPQMWIASKFMLILLAGVFAFFWIHSALWYYREHKDGCPVFFNKQGNTKSHIVINELLKGQAKGKQIRRFSRLARAAHLIFALVTMTLILTGMLVFYADTEWAHVVVRALGGAKIAGIIHRICATAFLGIFIAQLVYVLIKLLRSKTFKWFGPDSLIPNWTDLVKIIEMFKWFFGRGPRPVFDRWTYWEKFDFWAVFWGVGIIGSSGLMLAFPHVTASILPGWTFNVLTLVHGEEAFLAAVFLFTVHFFNNHFRPDKFPPPDVVMFTGSVPVEEFKREHTEHYNRLVESGELEKYLVDAPTRRMTLASKVLGITLIAIGLTLLVLVIIGFVGNT